MAAMSEFIARRRAAWEELAGLVQQAGARKGVRNLTRDQLRRLGPLYRHAAADLACARLRGGPPELEHYLSDLVTRAHGLVYAERGPGASRLAHFLVYGFPAQLRKNIRLILLAAAFFWMGALFAALICNQNPEAGKIFLGSQFSGRDEDTDFYKNLHKALGDDTRAQQAAFLMQNNIKATTVAFAVGIFGALPTVFAMLYNGCVIGVIGMAQHKAGYDLIFWSFIVPHGVIELTAIFIGGAAGMRLGLALLVPGEHSRADALKRAGADAIRLNLGAAGLLLLAGLLESYVSPTALPPAAKLTIGGTLFVALALYASLRPPVNPDGRRDDSGR